MNRYLVAQYGGWDEQVPWEKKLSLGEQQRIGLARLIYQKPTFGVLDECTDAVSAGDEKSLQVDPFSPFMLRLPASLFFYLRR